MLHRSALLFSLLFSFVSSVSSITFQWNHFYMVSKELEFFQANKAGKMFLLQLLWDDLKKAYNKSVLEGEEVLLLQSLLSEFLGNEICEQVSNPSFLELAVDHFKQFLQISGEKRFNLGERKGYKYLFKAMVELYHELFAGKTFDPEFSNGCVETRNFFYKLFNAFFVLQAAIFPDVKNGKTFALIAFESKATTTEDILKKVQENYIEHMEKEFYLEYISPIVKDVYNKLFEGLENYKNIDSVTKIGNFLTNPWNPTAAEEYEQRPVPGISSSWIGIQLKNQVKTSSANLAASHLGIKPNIISKKNKNKYHNPDKDEIEDQELPSLEDENKAQKDQSKSDIKVKEGKGALVKPMSKYGVIFKALGSKNAHNQSTPWISIKREAEKSDKEPKGFAQALLWKKSQEIEIDSRDANHGNDLVEEMGDNQLRFNRCPGSQLIAAISTNDRRCSPRERNEDRLLGSKASQRFNGGNSSKEDNPLPNSQRVIGLAEILHAQEKAFNDEKYVNEISSFIIQSVDGGVGMSDLHHDAKILSEKCITAGRIYSQTADVFSLIDLLTQCGQTSKEDLTQDSVATYLKDTSLDRYFEKALDEEYATTRELAQKIWTKVCKAEIYKDKKWNDETIKSLIQDPYFGKPRTQDPSSFIERLKNKKKKKRIARVENRLGIKETPKLLTAVVQKNEDSPRSARLGAIVPVQSFEKWRADEYKQYKQINIMLPKTINTADGEALKIWAKEIEEYKKQSAPHEPKKSKLGLFGSIGRLFSWLFGSKK